MNQPIAYQQHDHQHCIDSAIEEARNICRQQGARLTQQRENVLRLVWQSHRPLGAYALMEMLGKQLARPVAPPTVYRALDFLADLNLIHRVHSLNAFIGCPEPGRAHQDHFLICKHCGVVVECGSELLKSFIDKAANAADFQVEEQSLEIKGLCQACRPQASSRSD